MIPKPKVLMSVIIITAITMIATMDEAHNPETLTGVTFWLAMAIFAFCFYKLDKYEKFYEKCSDDELS